MQQKPAKATVSSKSNTNRLRLLLQRLRQFMGTSRARRIVLGFFVLQAMILVFTVRIGTPPDETNHLQFISFYANHSLSPFFDHQQPTYNLGDKTREVDYLYHYTMSLLVRILPLSPQFERYIIRLISVGVGLLTLIVLSRVFRRLNFSAATITTSLLIMSNLPMVLLMSSAINNDVFVWLGMAVGLLLLLRLWEKARLLDLVWLVNLAIYGGLVKRTLLPVGLALGLLAVVVLVRQRSGLRQQVHHLRWAHWLAIALLVVGLGLFSERVGGNLARYGSVTPTCEQVQGIDACYGFWANVRARNLAVQPVLKPISPPVFAVRWVNESLTNVVDIQTQGWRHEVKPAAWLTPLLSLALLIGLVFGVMYDGLHIKTVQHARWRLCFLAIAGYFTLIQLLVNYGSYNQYHVFGIALNGRYVLPSLLPLIGFACFYWALMLRRRPNVAVLLAITMIVSTIVGSGIVMMLRNPQLRLG